MYQEENRAVSSIYVAYIDILLSDFEGALAAKEEYSRFARTTTDGLRQEHFRRFPQ